MKKLKLTLVIFLSFISFVIAEEFKSVKIKGSISVNGELVKSGNIRFDVFKTPTLGYLFKYESFEAHLDDEGCFEVEITSPSAFFYIEVTAMLPPEIKRVLYTYYNKGKYLFNQNDSLEMKIEDNDILFSGRGSDRLNCQSEILQMIYSFRLKKSESRENDYYLRFKQVKEDLDEIEKKKLSILNKYKIVMDQEEVELIAKDINSLKKVTMLSFLGKYLVLGPESEAGVAKLYEEICNEQTEIDPSIFLQSAYFSDYLFQKAKVKAILTSMKPQIDLAIFTDSLFKIITRDYDGEIRDRLLLDFFISRQDRMSKEQAFRLFNRGVQFVKSEYCKQGLSEWADISFNLKKPIYPFKLVSAEGKIFSPADFKGKVVILKFWFWGCVPCAMLSTQMKPIMEKYASNPDVVFVNVNVDDHRKQWTLGLESGKYSNSVELNLYTNDFGRNHPMLKYYKFTGFPQLLMIDKLGNCLDRFIKRPIDDKSTEEFSILIDNALMSN